ncbi:D-alanyl-D-alanine carboxypeptidase family protein [Sphingomonas sp. DT-207]|uniref:M15 family metallopeptidase n=1 Tax=Sphingomonas sp. DT-207 TaxID=3396167 RepID=UPI003F1DBFAD
MRRSALALLLLFPFPSAAPAQEQAAPPAKVVRLYNHLPYGQANPAILVPVTSLPGCTLAYDAAADLERLLAAARGEGIDLGAVSCFRSIEHQRRVFCGGAIDCGSIAALRARFIAPPGHSEHATGYAIDFVQRNTGCRAAEQCFALTPAGKWLMRRGPDFGFELSFPAGNKQGVGWEPWHWRWVGRSSDMGLQAQAARSRFATAHASFPAQPAVPRPQAKAAAGHSPDRRSVDTARGGGGYAVSSSPAVDAAILLASSAMRRP